MSQTWFTGNWPAMITPMYDDGRVRLDSVPPLVEKFVQEGVGGIYLCGSTGQGPLLTGEERKAMAEATVKAAAGRVPVMVHVGSIRLDEAIDLARHAAAVGADAVSSVPPMYYPITFDATMEHYCRIGEATDLPFYAYNFALPNATVEAYVERLQQVPNARGLKFTNFNMYELALLKIHSEGRLNVLSGADESYLGAQAQGADGAIGSTQNIGMPIFRAVERAAVSGQWDEARRLMHHAVRLVHEVVIGCTLASVHTILTQQGIPCGQPRHPLKKADAATAARAWQRYREIMAEAGVGVD